MPDPIPAFGLVIPCYNESRGLSALVRRVETTAREGNGEIVLVDNGSTDDTAAVLTELLGPADPVGGSSPVRWIQVPVNRGYGYGITQGLKVARGPVIGWTHADLQTDPADVLRFMPVFAAGSGSAFGKGRRYGRPIADRVFTAGMSVFETVLLRTPLRDINAQPTVFRRELIELWGTPPDDFSLDLFAMYQAKRHGFRIFRLPVIFAPRQFGTSSWNTDLSAKRKFIKRTLTYSMSLRRSL